MRHVHAFGDDCLGDLDATGLAAELAAGHLSSLEVVDAALDRIDAVNGSLHAVAFDDRERARKRASDNAFPPEVFAGVPAMIKNNTRFAGLPTCFGSAAVPVRPAPADEAFTRQLVATGVNIVGASTMPAFGLTATTEFVDREPTRNPWDTDFSCGASSGGSSALVAAGAIPIAHANDGGGSIRIPAAACGLVGLKVSRGRLAPAEASESAPIDLVANGIVSRTVRDTANFLESAEKYRRASGFDPIGPVRGPSDRRVRIAVMTDSLTSGSLDPDSERAVEQVRGLLESLGHRTESIPVPVDASFVDHFTDYWSLMAFSLEFFGNRVVDKDFDRSRIDPFTHGLSRRFMRRFWRTPLAIRGLRRSTSAFRKVLGDYDIVLSPTLGHATPEIGYLDPAGDFDEIFDRLIRYVAFTPANNTSGTPGISLPLAQTEGGLPLGMHFSADLGDERTLLELAFELEAAQPFARITC